MFFPAPRDLSDTFSNSPIQEHWLLCFVDRISSIITVPKAMNSSMVVREMQKGIPHMGGNCSCLVFPEVL
jgi:hypothetical protein